jgi:hypothetical protein
MMPTLQILEVGFSHLKRSLPEFDPKFLPENGFGGIYMLPNVSRDHQAQINRSLDARFVKKVDFTKIPYK